MKNKIAELELRLANDTEVMKSLLEEYGFVHHRQEVKDAYKHHNGSVMLIFHDDSWMVKDPHGQVLGKGKKHDTDRLEKALGVAS